MKHPASNGCSSTSPRRGRGQSAKARKASDEVRFVTEGIIDVLQFAVDSLSLARNVDANDVANAQTPGYLAKEVSFQKSLESALNGGDRAKAEASVYTSPEAPGTDGNNVDLTEQMVSLEKATLESETVVEMMNSQFGLIRGAMGGSFT
jgi:flagellar basal-body rod protein FlgB